MAVVLVSDNDLQTEVSNRFHHFFFNWIIHALHHNSALLVIACLLTYLP